jgi:hypothetical protein
VVPPVPPVVMVPALPPVLVPPVPPVPAAHTPALQALAPQLTPQLPQFAGSDCTFTQRSPQNCSWAPAHVHVPLVHVCPDAQA